MKNTASEHFECSQDFMDLLRVALATSHEEPGFAGIPIQVSPFMPDGMAVLIDSEGKPIKIFKIETDGTKDSRT